MPRNKSSFLRLCLLAGFGLSLAALPAGAVTLPSQQLGPSLALLPTASVDEMPPEQARAFIVGIQEALSEHGYKPGPADGVMGERTRTAIRAYQRDAGLPVDGVASNELLDHLNFATPKVYARSSSAPSRTTVLKVQGALATRGYYTGSLDGETGSETRKAVEAFQKDAGLTVTGKIDNRLVEEIRLTPLDLRDNPVQVEKPEEMMIEGEVVKESTTESMNSEESVPEQVAPEELVPAAESAETEVDLPDAPAVPEPPSE